ncbi:MAG: metallophosphoesterase [Gemmatimonadetes bacterium]|nr:metallophosphoesterase [Gemmatimonadota bacterium]
MMELISDVALLWASFERLVAGMPRFLLFATAAYVILFFTTLGLVAGVHRHWWRVTWFRRLFYWQFPLALLGAVFRVLSRYYDVPWLWAIGTSLFSALTLYLGAFFIAALLMTPVVLGVLLYDRLRQGGAEEPSSFERRRFLSRGLAVVPALGAVGVSHGIYTSYTRTRMPVVPLHYPGLPAELEGLKILHLSDMHIGPYVQLADLEALLVRAAQAAPDLIAITGDVCDHNPDYLATLRLIESVPTRLGAYASLGNHEYMRGIRRIRRHFDQTAIPLLVNEGLTVPVGAATLYLGGVDDPRFLRSPASYAQLRNSVEKAVSASPSDAFTVLMSHRSQALDYAAPLGGTDLILAGHTHGFQLGMAGRSFFEPFFPERYIWGHYEKGTTQLYTTAGVGHWLPFRFGCPPEAPIITLHRA